jgi:hypothetical protein
MNAITKTEVVIKNSGDGVWKWLVEVEYFFDGDTWRILEEGIESSYLTAKEAADESLYQTEKEILAEQRGQQ